MGDGSAGDGDGDGGSFGETEHVVFGDGSVADEQGGDCCGDGSGAGSVFRSEGGGYGDGLDDDGRQGS